MSSGEEDNHEGEQGLSQDFKKRRIQRACDTCRRKKIRCDGGQMPGNRCSNCSAYNLDCTYVEAAKKRGPPKGYVESLENRLENMEKLLQRLCPDADFTQELGPHIDRENWSLDRRGLEVMPASDNRQGDIRRRNLARMVVPSGPPLTGDISAGCYNDDDFAASEDELGTGTLAEGLKRLAVDPLDRRFHGKSSGVMLVQTAMNLKQEFSGGEVRKSLMIPPTRRPEFWSPHPWEIVSMECGVQYLYPPDDLLPVLVDYYFQNLNPYLPLLHRPSFERALTDRRHHTDVGFGSVVMLVCSIGARWSDDRRCCLEGTGAHSAGWKWFDQVQVHRKSFMGPPRLYDLQIYALSSLFLQYSSSPQSSWTMVGIGLRLAQDVGAHRRKVYNAPLSVESELWKRAFWVLVSMDRFGSAALGRPCAIQDEDFDLELPLEVDDEYWEHPDPTKAFKQPPGIPCSISYFISFLKLNQILAFALRTIYSINKSKILLGFVGPQWEQHIVAELDSALNKWIDTVPDHLRWDPHRENALHFNQSATLYATYYHLQILIHRPFIPSPRKPSPLAFPSLAICTNAARSCSHVTDICRRRGVLPLPQMQIAAFSSGIVLLLNIWGAKKSGTYVDTEKQMSDVRKCMNVLRSIEGRFISAGRLWDILNELACAGDIPLDKATPPPNNKRERGSDSPISNEASPSPSQVPIQDGARPVAGRRNLSAFSSSFSAHAAASSGLPYDTEQLSRANPELVPNLHTSGVNGAGNNNNNNNNNNNSLSVPWLSSTQVPGGGGGAPPPTGSNSVDQMFGTSSNVNGMPNLNIFDLFQSDPQMFNVPMLDNQQGYHLPTVNSAPTQGMGKTSSYAPETEAHGSGFGQLDGSLPSEALQMWSTAPTSFDLEDWGSYLHNVNGSSAENVPAQRG